MLHKKHLSGVRKENEIDKKINLFNHKMVLYISFFFASSSAVPVHIIEFVFILQVKLAFIYITYAILHTILQPTVILNKI
jgi:hypothetical protein